MQASFPQETTPSKHVKPGSRNPLLGMPILGRLLLGFFIPAIIASITAGSIGYQSSLVLRDTSDFYQALFSNYSSLVLGENDTQFIGTQIRIFIADWRNPAVPRQNVQTEQTNLHNLTVQYDTLIHNYVQYNLLVHHPDQVAFFSEAGRNVQPQQQQILAANALLSWQTYLSVQNTIIADLQANRVDEALALQRSQGRADITQAQLSMQKLIQFDQNLVLSIRDIVSLQQQRVLLFTSVAIIFVFLTILVVGWLISGTLSPRLQELRRVAQAVKQGELKVRVSVNGQDEITDVASAMNNMLDTTVDLVDVTRKQRDALKNAADRLYGDMFFAVKGTPFSSSPITDPIALLSHAFSRTTGRFRHFALHVNDMADQTDAISRRIKERATAILQTSQKQGLDPATIAFAQNMLALADHLRSLSNDVQNDLATFQGEDSSRTKR